MIINKTKREMKKLLLLLLVPLGQTLFGHGPHGNHGHHDHMEPETEEERDYLQNYSLDLLDSDGDGMTDVAELKYGFDPNSALSFPELDFLASDIPYTESTKVVVENYEFVGLGVVPTDVGINIVWNETDTHYSFSKYSLILSTENRNLYYGGHGPGIADLPYSVWNLNGDEILYGKLIESNPKTGQFVREHSEFEIDLSEYEIPEVVFGDVSNKIKFKFVDFSDEQKSLYIDFIQRLLPIMEDIYGPPSESFTCEFVMQEGDSGSWMTVDHGRKIYLDSNWNPRLLVHEMIHTWEGKLGFSWSGQNRDYSDDLSGFSEVAEGVAYKILHDFVSAYPTHHVSKTTATGGAWNNWTSNAWSYDLYKHQRFTGGGTFWTGDMRAVDHRYSIAGMLMQIILVHDKNFIRKTRSELFEIANLDTKKILSRDEIVSLWANNIKEINGVDSRSYLNSLPVLNGKPIDQGFYPVVNIRNQSDVDIFSTYSVGGNFWWYYVDPSNIKSFNVPSWVKYNYDSDGYYYIDTNNLRFNLSVKNLEGETIQSRDLVSDNTYQNESKTVPMTLGEIRIVDQMTPSTFSQGLYEYDITYTDLISYTTNANAQFYFMGEKDLYQSENSVVLMFGIDSMFAETLEIIMDGKSFELDVINGCAVLNTSELSFNYETVMTLIVNSKDESHTYKRALVQAGNSWGEYRQQFLIIDRDFDGIEDLYDQDISDSFIATKYHQYKSRYKNEIINPPSDDNADDHTEYDNPFNFIPPADGLIVSQSLVSYYNPTTGETWVAPTGGWTAPDGWVIGTKDEYETDEWVDDTETDTNEWIDITDNNTNDVWIDVNDDSSDDEWIFIDDSEQTTEDSIDDVNESTNDTNEDVEEDNSKLIDDNVAVESSQINWNSSIKIGNGWEYLEWFGYFFKSNENVGWIYHYSLGWLYTPSNSVDSIWMYSEKYGWIWTTNNFFPFVFIRDSGWVYFNFEQNLYYDFKQQTYNNLK